MEKENIITWLERRLEWADRYTLPIYVRLFRNMWFEQFGTVDDIPQDLKDRTNEMYKGFSKGD